MYRIRNNNRIRIRKFRALPHCVKLIHFLIAHGTHAIPLDRRSRRERGGEGTVGAGVGVARYPESLVAGARQRHETGSKVIQRRRAGRRER